MRITPDFFGIQRQRTWQAAWVSVLFFALVNLTVWSLTFLLALVILTGYILIGSEAGKVLPAIYVWPLSVFVVGFVIASVTLWHLFRVSRDGGAICRDLGAFPLAAYPDARTRVMVENIVEELTIAAQMPISPAVYVIPSPSINALAAGVRPDRLAMAVTTGALEALDRSELMAVMGHEFGHLHYGDSRDKSYLFAAVRGLVFFHAIGRASSRGLLASNDRSDRWSLLVVILLPLLFAWCLRILSLVGVLSARLLVLLHSRFAEYRADAYAIQLLRDSRPLVSVFEKMLGLRRPALTDRTEYLHFLLDSGSWWAGMEARHLSLPRWMRLKWRDFDDRGAAAAFLRLLLVLFGPMAWLALRTRHAFGEWLSTHPDWFKRIRAINPHYSFERFRELMQTAMLASRQEQEFERG